MARYQTSEKEYQCRECSIIVTPSQMLTCEFVTDENKQPLFCPSCGEVICLCGSDGKVFAVFV